MPPRFEDDSVAAIKRAISIVDYVGEHVALTRRGRTFVGLCPFHDDHKPSFDVDPERQRYRCWSCGAKGDLFDFVMQLQRITFREALEQLAERAGVTLRSNADRGNGDQRKRLYDMLRWAETEYQRCLRESAGGEPGRRYLTQRGLDDLSVERFHLGFAPQDWQWLLNRARSQRIAAEALEQVGLAKPRESKNGHYDTFRGRLMFPIRDTRGRTIAFGGRILPEFSENEPAKYLNSPETPVFSKREHLYGLDQARDALLAVGSGAVQPRTIAVVEGYTDCIMAHQFGLRNVVGTLGTALGDSHVALLKRHADRVVLVFDGDEAGIRAADRALGILLNHELDLRVVVLPDDLDPCDFLLERGGDAFRALLAGATEPIDFKLARASQLFDLTATDGRRRVLDYVLEAIAAIASTDAQATSVGCGILVDRLAQRLGLTHEVVQRRLRELRQKARRTESPARSSRTPEPPTVPKPSPWAGEDRTERELLEIVLSSPACLKTAAASVRPEDLRTTGFRELYAACLALDAEGEPIDADRVRWRVNDPELAARASRLAEDGALKAANPTVSLPQWLGDVVARIAARDDEQEASEIRRGWNAAAGNDDEEQRLLARIHARVQPRHSKPQATP